MTLARDLSLQQASQEQDRDVPCGVSAERVVVKAEKGIPGRGLTRGLCEGP